MLVQSERERAENEVRAVQQARVAEAVRGLRGAAKSLHWESIWNAADELNAACTRAGVDNEITNWIELIGKSIATGLRFSPTKTDRKCAAFLVGTIETLLDWDCGI